MNTQKKTGIATLLATLAMTGATAFGITIDTVTVGNIGNAPKIDFGKPTWGSVSYEYQIGTYEVTTTQYVAFLNAVDSSGTNSLGLFYVTSDSRYGIEKASSGTSGNWYSVKSGWENKPVNYVSFYSAARFVNWLTNGQGSGGTETGMYTLSDGNGITRNAEAWAAGGFAIASHDEWYKAAYYNPTLNDGAGGYTNFPWGNGEPSHTREAVNGANYSGGPGNVTDIGYYINALSYYGTYDQMGNLWEWTDDPYGISDRIRRGGAYDAEYNYTSASYGAVALGPTNELANLGFRVASLTAVPEPGTYAAATGLITLVIGMWLRRGRRAGRG